MYFVMVFNWFSVGHSLTVILLSAHYEQIWNDLFAFQSTTPTSWPDIEKDFVIDVQRELNFQKGLCIFLKIMYLILSPLAWSLVLKMPFEFHSSQDVENSLTLDFLY